MRLVKILATALIAVSAAIGMSGCTADPLDPADYAMVIDVRTSEEWTDGRLKGAVRMGIADSDFLVQLAALDKSEDYYIYCRSGNRAGQAIDMMRDLGFTGELVNGGSLANASSQLGLSIVTN